MACQDEQRILSGRIQSVLLSTDYVPDAIVDRLQRAWGCRVFKHYGMTEMGLGGAVECAARNGYHGREADFWVEIVDPQSGLPVADGTWGEIVFTTLTREGMPLIRYRTGDLAAFRVAPCPCGTLLKTLGRVKGRLNGMLTLNPRDTLFIGDLDEAIFSVEGVINYDASMDAECGIDRFTVRVDAQPSSDMVAITDRMRRNVTRLPPVRSAIDDGLLILSIRSMDQYMTVSTGMVRRKFIDLR